MKTASRSKRPHPDSGYGSGHGGHGKCGGSSNDWGTRKNRGGNPLELAHSLSSIEGLAPDVVLRLPHWGVISAQVCGERLLAVLNETHPARSLVIEAAARPVEKGREGVIVVGAKHEPGPPPAWPSTALEPLRRQRANMLVSLSLIDLPLVGPLALSAVGDLGELRELRIENCAPLANEALRELQDLKCLHTVSLCGCTGIADQVGSPAASSAHAEA